LARMLSKYRLLIFTLLCPYAVVIVYKFPVWKIMGQISSRTSIL
jgi:hypothetical protein